MPPSLSSLKSRAARLRTYLRDIDTHPDRKPRLQIARELLAYRRAGIPRHFYLERLLYQRAAGDPANYLTQAETWALWERKRRPAGYLRVFDDKTLFDEHLRRDVGTEPVPLPAYLGQTRAGVLIRPGRTDVWLRDRDAFGHALAEMAEESPTGRVFAKPANDSKGAGAMLVRSAPSEGDVDRVRDGASRVDYLFQEAVDQHHEMDRINPACLNTLRIVTGTAKDGSYPVLGAILRIGQGGNPVDNAHAGGLFVGVDRETGRLGPRAHAFFEFGGATHTRHPDTGTVFDGFEVPYFAEAVALARRAHARLPLLYVGWDVGITPDGPRLIEGNSGAHLSLMEVAAGGFKADPIARAFLVGQGVLS